MNRKKWLGSPTYLLTTHFWARQSRQKNEFSKARTPRAQTHIAEINAITAAVAQTSQRLSRSSAQVKSPFSRRRAASSTAKPFATTQRQQPQPLKQPTCRQLLQPKQFPQPIPLKIPCYCCSRTWKPVRSSAKTLPIFTVHISVIWIVWVPPMRFCSVSISNHSQVWMRMPICASWSRWLLVSGKSSRETINTETRIFLEFCCFFFLLLSFCFCYYFFVVG